MGQVFLAKSAMTDFDEQDRIVGSLDISINCRGQAEIAELVRELADQPIDTVFAADSAAARETGERLAKELGVRYRELEDLRNLDFGLWQGLPVAEVERNHRKLYSRWKSTPCEACPPAGEQIGDVYERVEKILGPIIKKNSFRGIVIIAPDPLRRIIRCYLKEKRIDNVLISNAGEPVEHISV